MEENSGKNWRFKEDCGDVLYIRDVSRLIATQRRQKRLVLSGEIVSSIDELKSILTEKLAMHSTNVRKSFRALDLDHSGRLDRFEFKRFLENLNIHCSMSAFKGLFDLLDYDGSGSVEYIEFMKSFGNSIAGEKLTALQLDGEERAARKLALHVGRRDKIAGRVVFTAEQARASLAEKLATMGTSVRRIFAHVNTDFQKPGEAEGGLDPREFKLLLDKFNIPMADEEYRKLYSMVDPDGSNTVTYSEFQKEFGTSISGGPQCIRWGATALPRNFKAAQAWDDAAVNAETNVSGPEVQASGSVEKDEVLDKRSGFLVQTVAEQLRRESSDSFELELKVQHLMQGLPTMHVQPKPANWKAHVAEQRQKVLETLPAKEVARLGGGVDGKSKEGAGRRPSTGTKAAVVGKSLNPRFGESSGAAGRSGGGGGAAHVSTYNGMGKAEFMLQRRQMKTEAKNVASSKPTFGSASPPPPPLSSSSTLALTRAPPSAKGVAPGRSVTTMPRTAGGGDSRGVRGASGGGGGGGGGGVGGNGGKAWVWAGEPGGVGTSAEQGYAGTIVAELSGAGNDPAVPPSLMSEAAASAATGSLSSSSRAGLGDNNKSSAHPSGSSSANATARANSSHECAARMRDAFDRAHRHHTLALPARGATPKTASSAGRRTKQKMRSTTTAITPVLASGAMPGERPGMMSTYSRPGGF
eukprot:CAMPEP_0171698832 /NCGR_PEP_ID=MMETSP0991-20121206/9575_1 /TAXON_ID=483369 /ORGANISM="non described non described, Strain CCMP2098" /LENGTH=694 /DNA_ID=CAMNT_0012287739 /DNA_START=131 /DNA_END=2215 /DNA_ORIENTATION=+